jgi:3-phenylpropionate/cinnamic acid dioxygenase small subunit
MAKVNDALGQLAARIGALEDERAIADTINRYSHAIDYGSVDEWLDCFTPDGTIEVQAAGRETSRAGFNSSAHGRSGRHTGSKQLRAFIEAQSHPPDAWHKHVVSQTRVVLEGDTATAVSFLSRIDETDGRLGLYSMGRYVDRLVRSTDGRWRIAERVVQLEAVNPATR